MRRQGEDLARRSFRDFDRFDGIWSAPQSPLMLRSSLVHGAKSLPCRRVADLRAAVQFSRMLLPLIVTSEFAFTLILRLP